MSNYAVLQELNDGVFWRLTVPSVSIQSGSEYPFLISDIVFLSIELLHCDLASDDTDSNELYAKPDQYLPEELKFSVISTQYIALQHISSGLHEYYSVNFDADNYVVVDLMVHCCITAVHYPTILFYPEIKRDLQRTLASSSVKPNGQEDSKYSSKESNSVGTLRKTRVTTTVDTSADTTLVTNKSKGLFGLGRFLASPEKLLFGSGDRNGGSASSNKAKGVESAHVDQDHSLLKVTVNPITIASAIRRRVSISGNKMEVTTSSSNIPGEASDDASNATDEAVCTETSSVAESEDNSAAGETTDTAGTSTLQIPSRDRIATVYDMYTAAVIQNYHSAVESIQNLLVAVSQPDHHAQLLLSRHEEGTDENNEDSADGHTDSNNASNARTCPLLSNREANINALVNTAKAYGGSSPSSQHQQQHQQQHHPHSATRPTGRSKVAINQSLALILQQIIDACQEDLALQWSLHTATLRRNVFPLRHYLMKLFFREQGIFWKQQMISHTREYDESHSIASAKDTEMWQILSDHISSEKEYERDKLLSAAVINNNNSERSRTTVSRGHYARGLRMFDWRILRLPSRLPYLLLEQYSLMGGPNLVTMPVPATEDETDMSHNDTLLASDDDIYSSVKCRGSRQRKQEIFHVIFLQHGFLGGPFDMRQLAHALQMLLIPTDVPHSQPDAYTPLSQQRQYPYNSHRTHHHHHRHGMHGPSGSTASSSFSATHVKHTVLIHSCCSNEGTPSNSGGIREMGLRMADEILGYLRDKAPVLLDESAVSPRSLGSAASERHRVSFIGHSLGGLIIRSALQEERMQCLRPYLHTFLSLATPHVGNLYSDSSLVSTGMWALAKFKNYRCLQELVLEDAPKDVAAPPSVQEHEDVLRQQSLLFRLSLPTVPMTPAPLLPSSGKLSSPPLPTTSMASTPSSSTRHGPPPAFTNALSDFKHVICVSSPKDQYVSTYSARIQLSPKVESDAQRGVLLAMYVSRMIDQLTRDVLSASQLVRVMVVNNEEDVAACANGGMGMDAFSAGSGNGGSGTGSSAGSGNSSAASALVTDAVSVPTLMNTLLAHDLTGNSSSNGNGNNAVASVSGTALTMFFGGVTDVNSAIGRSAHICYLDNAVVAHQLIFTCLQYFQS